MSVANVAIIPGQDLLGLGSEARMNRPGVEHGNWAFRLDERRAHAGARRPPARAVRDLRPLRAAA